MRAAGAGARPAGRIFVTGRSKRVPAPGLRPPSLPRPGMRSLPVFSSLPGSPRPAAPASQAQTAKGLGNFRGTLKPGREPAGTALRGRGCLGDDGNTACLWRGSRGCGAAARSPQQHRAAAGGQGSEGGGGQGRPGLSSLRCYPREASRAGCGRCRQRPIILSDEETEAQRGAVTGPRSHSRER